MVMAMFVNSVVKVLMVKVKVQVVMLLWAKINHQRLNANVD